MKNKKKSGFTLIEVLITSAILIVALVNTLGFFAYSLSAAGGDRSFAIAQYEAEKQMESISELDYLTIKNTFTNAGALKDTLFPITSELVGQGVVYAAELPDAADILMRVKVAVCYRNRDRTVGEDANFNGTLDSGEDANGNGEIDSSCQIETVLANKE